jgi:predicted ATPase/DNA-binding XRE family transcriptional regulator
VAYFGDELRRLRKHFGLSQEALAHRAGLTPEAVSLLERGRREPRMSTLQLLAQAMRLPDADAQALFASASRRSARSNDLPILTDVLVGADQSVADLVRLLENPQQRLITVTGPPGVGKTRVAISAAHQLADRVLDGIHWLPLSSMTDPDALAPALAASLGLRQSQHRSISAIIDQLADRHTLLVVDGGQHLGHFRTELCAAVLERTHGVRILLTSRELLHLPGEVVFPVRTLPLPPRRPTRQQLNDAAAGRLFLTRAQAHDSDFAVSEADLTSIAEICRRLDGLPLAIELAAARTSVLTVEQLAQALGDTLDILRSPADGGQSRLDATLEWSYQLLDADERRLLEDLSVFGRSFTVEAAAQVSACGGPTVGMVNLISSLVAKSLVLRMEDAAGAAQFTLLQLVRHYAGERLVQSGRANAVRRRHAEYFAALARQAEPHLTTGDQHHWLALLDSEFSNLRRAVQWLTAHQPAGALTMINLLWRWCYVRGLYTEGRAWADAALSAGRDAPAAVRATALAGAGMLAFLQCDYETAEKQTRSALELYTALEDEVGIARTLSRLGALAREQADYVGAEELHNRALELAIAHHDRHGAATQLNYLSFVAWLRGDLDRAHDLSSKALTTMTRLGDREGIAWALINSGVVAHHRGDLVGADLLLEQSLEVCEEIRFREGVAWSLNQLGVVARLRGDPAHAADIQRASLAEHRDLGDRWRAASVMEELAANAAATGDAIHAARWLGAAEGLRELIGTPVPAIERPVVDETTARARTLLGPTFDAARIAGMSQPLSFPEPDADPAAPDLFDVAATSAHPSLTDPAGADPTDSDPAGGTFWIKAGRR